MLEKRKQNWLRESCNSSVLNVNTVEISTPISGLTVQAKFGGIEPVVNVVDADDDPAADINIMENL